MLAVVPHSGQFEKLFIVTKTFYAERGDVNSCADWLAVGLGDAFRTDERSFDLAALKACLKDNGIEARR